MLQAREQDIINQKEDIAFRKREIRRLEDENQYVSKVLHDVLNSTSWKLTEPVRRSMVIGHKGASKAKTAAKMVRDAVDTKQVVKSYNSPDFAIEHVQRAEDIELALIVHLYYTESWPLLKEKLRLIQSKESKSDLFVTLPKHNAAFAKNIKADFPHAYTLIVPNRGRDVLPFLQVSKALKSLGYKYFLKVHSKRSPHRKDGSDWFSDIINSLVPGNTEVIGQILEQLKKEGTGIIGPAGQYISLLVNYEANQSKLHAIVRDTISNAAAEKIKEQKTDYGFMAGTMFWGRFDALAPLLAEKYDAAKFDPERGQIDGTTAHAMERAFCLVPELNRKQILEIDESGLHKVAYKTDNIPDWSDVYIGPKA
jgi:lipopolysaccharide biosynthesis protein